MPKYKCTKEGCGETMHSKHPAFRSIFPSDSVASMMTNIVNVTTLILGEKAKRVVTFEFPYCDTDDEQPDDQLEMQCARNIKHLTDDQITHWLCDHKWELVSGEVTVTC